MVDRVGQRLGSYRLVKLLGRGGFADVYLGEHVYLKTQVAVKVLQARLTNPDDMESFLSEAQMIARLLHPNIIRMLDFGVEADIPYQVMDYAPNGTLRRRYPKGTKLPLAMVVGYIRQLAEALQYAHEEKLIHRDIKPENMLIGRRGEVLLSDFGIALIAQSSQQQSTQDVVGTVAYMSPEQIQGRTRSASDQYSLAIVTYEWLCGERPFKGSFTELCTQHMFADPPFLREKLPDLSVDVEQVVLTALAKDPKQRFASILAFATALEQASRSSPITDGSLPKVLPEKPFSIEEVPLVLSPTGRVEHHLLAQQPRVSLSSLDLQIPEHVVRATTSPLGQEQLMNVPALPPVSRELPSSSLPGQDDPMTQAHLSTSVVLKGRTSVWSFGKQQLRTSLIAIALVGLVYYGIHGLLPSSLSEPFFVSTIKEITLSLSVTSILLGASLVLPFFFGALSGPWVGLLSMSVGTLLSDSLFLHISHPWYWYVCTGLIGFIAGLSLQSTQGRYNRATALLSTISICFAGLIAATLCDVIGDRMMLQLDLNLSLSELLSHILSGLFGLIILPVFLLVYDLIIYRKRAPLQALE